MDIPSFLSTCVFPITKSEVYNVLRLVASMIEYNDVFAAFFLEEFQHACTLLEQGLAPLFPLYKEAYAPHEIRLLECINAQLCPLGDLQEHLEEEASPEERWYDIPIISLGFDDLDDENLEYALYENEMSLGWCLMLYLCGPLNTEFFDGMSEEGIESLFAMEIEQGIVDGDLLANECKQQIGPLAFFEQALDVLEHTTGTPFLDATSQFPKGPVPMTPESLRSHVEQYHKALRIKANADLFIDWINEKPVSHFMEVITLWNHCMKETRTKKQMETQQVG